MDSMNTAINLNTYMPDLCNYEIIISFFNIIFFGPFSFDMVSLFILELKVEDERWVIKVVEIGEMNE